MNDPPLDSTTSPGDAPGASNVSTPGEAPSSYGGGAAATDGSAPPPQDDPATSSNDTPPASGTPAPTTTAASTNDTAAPASDPAPVDSAPPEANQSDVAAGTINPVTPDLPVPPPSAPDSDRADLRPADATEDTGGAEASALPVAEGDASPAAADAADPAQADDAANPPPTATETLNSAGTESDQADQKPVSTEIAATQSAGATGNKGSTDATPAQSEGDASPVSTDAGSSGLTEEQHKWTSNFLALDPTAAKALLAPAITRAAPYLLPAIAGTVMGPVGVAVAVGAAVFLYSRDAGDAWDGATNPETGKPYTSQEEYDRVRASKGNPNKGREKDKGAGKPNRDPQEEVEDEPKRPDDQDGPPTPKPKRTCFDIYLEQRIEACEDLQNLYDSEADFLRRSPDIQRILNDGGTRSSSAGRFGEHITYLNRAGKKACTLMVIQCCEDLPEGPTIRFPYHFAG